MKRRNFPKFSLSAPALMLLIAFIWNQSTYLLGRLIAQSWPHFDMTLPWDLRIPFLPWTVAIYFGCYLFWGVSYYLISRQDDLSRTRFFCADLFSKSICLLFFVLIPTTNVRPEITGSGFFASLMRLLYQLDAPDNLFPSIHCLVSYQCYIGVRGRKDVPLAYRLFSLFTAIAICISTLTTRQHVLCDVFASIALAELAYWVGGFEKVRARYAAFIASFQKNPGRIPV